MKYVVRTLSVLVVAVALSGFSIACNTMEGAGKDIERGGDNLKDAARDARN
jgi:predicted small secreted protein